MIICKILRIEEPDFGCEGRPDGYIQQDKVYVIDKEGSEFVLNIEDSFLYKNNINEGDYIKLKSTDNPVILL